MQKTKPKKKRVASKKRPPSRIANSRQKNKSKQNRVGDSPIDISDTSTRGRVRIIQYQIDDDFLVVTSGNGEDAIISVRGYHAAMFQVRNSTPAFSYDLTNAAPWTLTLNDTVTLHSDDNHRITMDFGGDQPSTAVDGTVVFREHLTAATLVVNENQGGTTVFPDAQHSVPAPGYLSTVIIYRNRP